MIEFAIWVWQHWVVWAWRRLTIRSEVVRRLERLSDVELDGEARLARNSAYLALRLVREWLDCTDVKLRDRHDGVIPAVRLHRTSKPSQHVWAYSGGHRVSGPLVSMEDDGSALVYDNRSGKLAVIDPAEVIGGDVRSERWLRGQHPSSEADVQEGTEAD